MDGEGQVSDRRPEWDDVRRRVGDDGRMPLPSLYTPALADRGTRCRWAQPIDRQAIDGCIRCRPLTTMMSRS